MGVTVVLGNAGAGKTSFITARIKYLLKTEGKTRLRKCVAMLNKFNEERETPLTLPDKVPIYTNFDVTFKAGYEKKYKPYYINESYFGLPNCDKPVIPVVPYSIIGLQEMDDEYNSRARSISKAVAGLYNKRRHIGLEIFMDLHRVMIVDSIIREVTDVFIWIEKQEHEKNEAGRIIKTTWYCREFEDVKEILRYIETKGAEGNYRTTEYVNEGNIFKCFDSHNCAEEFIPKDGDDFIYLPQKSEAGAKAVAPELAKFYEKGAVENGAGSKKRTGGAGAEAQGGSKAGAKHA